MGEGSGREREVERAVNLGLGEQEGREEAEEGQGIEGGEVAYQCRAPSPWSSGSSAVAVGSSCSCGIPGGGGGRGGGGGGTGRRRRRRGEEAARGGGVRRRRRGEAA